MSWRSIFVDLAVRGVKRHLTAALDATSFRMARFKS